jgi:hypothetical protein
VYPRPAPSRDGSAPNTGRTQHSWGAKSSHICRARSSTSTITGERGFGHNNPILGSWPGVLRSGRIVCGGHTIQTPSAVEENVHLATKAASSPVHKYAIRDDGKGDHLQLVEKTFVMGCQCSLLSLLGLAQGGERVEWFTKNWESTRSNSFTL